MSDNLIQFPGKEEPQLTPEQTEEMKKLEQAQLILETIQKQRKNGLATLQKKVQSLLDNEKLTHEHMTPATVMVLRDTVGALNSELLILEAHDKLIDMVINDLGGTVMNLEMLSKTLMQNSYHLQTLLALLTEKGIINKDDMKAKWNELLADIKKRNSQSTEEEIRSEEL